MSKLAENLKYYRKINKLTQTQLATELGVAFSTVSMWERSENEPDIETLFKIAKIFNVDITDLIKSDEPIDENEFDAFVTALKARGITEQDLKNMSEKEKRTLYTLIEQMVNNID